ncbi:MULTISPECIES: hypothetical protein [Bacteroidaceae]|uniref:hypothetical protein n=1 Tax=Bacteroidaceae TaxID=815 RepID=UPI00117F4718|nr:MULTISPECIES: hypothetical protein [Bacteroidaceae]MDM8305045.1 hypothetical protein [Phocaeicola salanitronis]
MKKFKFGVLAMALVSMLGFTSCLDSGDPGPQQVGGYMEVSSSFYGTTFLSDYGVTFVPTQMLTSSPTSSVAYIYGTLPEDEVVTAETKSVNINLAQDPIYLREMSPVLTSVPEKSQTVGLYEMRGCAIWGEYKYFIYSFAYLLKKGTTTETVNTARDEFRINVYYDSNETGVAKGTLKLHIRCEAKGIDTSKENWGQEYTAGYLEDVFVRMDPIISQYKANNNGEYPKRIEVEYEKSSLVYATSDPNAKLSQTISIENSYLPNMSKE